MRSELKMEEQRETSMVVSKGLSEAEGSKAMVGRLREDEGGGGDGEEEPGVAHAAIRSCSRRRRGLVRGKATV